MTEERECMEFDVLIVGAGPSGLAAACHVMQLAKAQQQELSVCVIEKASEVGAHILSGAILDTRALQELFPDWQERGAPLETPVTEEHVWWLKDSSRFQEIPHWMTPPSMLNTDQAAPHYIISAGQLCRWMATQAEALGVDIFPGFPAQSLIIEEGEVKGVLTGDMGLDTDGNAGINHVPAMELRARYTLFCEGARGHLGQQLITHYGLDDGKDPQHYAIGLKELWQVPAEQHSQGTVIHGSGWPLDKETHGGYFMYHAAHNQVVVGLIVDLNYRNPWLSPFDELQRLKHHPAIAKTLQNGERLTYGARAITKGGYNSLPRMVFPGGLLLGCDAGTLDFARIKGIHTAMKSGMVAANCIIDAFMNDGTDSTLKDFPQQWENCWAGQELKVHRSFGPAMHKYGKWLGGAWNLLDQRFSGRLPTVKDTTPDYRCLKQINQVNKIDYPKPDGKLSFDKPSSVYLSGTHHRDGQPCHIKLKDITIPLNHNLPMYAEPAQRYCPAGVYEVVGTEEEPTLQINYQNCLHCKTCDIKDPKQNIIWMPPEGGEGPLYQTM